MLVVTLTSWVKRISNVRKVVESIMGNTVKPDRVYLNLSSSEFKGIELPNDLVEYFNSDKRLVINWVDGENTKSMKKVFPILKYLKDEDIIIDADDDILFPKDLIESRLKDFDKYGGKFPITSNPRTSVGFGGKMKVVSAISLFQKKMLKNWDKFVTNRILKTYNDDRTYLYLFWLNGYENRSCSKWNVQQLIDKYDMHLKNGMKENKINIVGGRYDKIVMEEMGMNVDKMFGLYNKNINTKIMKLRKDISEGKVIQVSLGSDIVWKKVK